MGVIRKINIQFPQLHVLAQDYKDTVMVYGEGTDGFINDGYSRNNKYDL